MMRADGRSLAQALRTGILLLGMGLGLETQGCAVRLADEEPEPVAAVASTLAVPSCPAGRRTVRADGVPVELCSIEFTATGQPAFVYFNPVLSSATDTILATASIFCTRDGEPIDPELIDDRAHAAANILRGETLSSNRPRLALLPGTGRILCKARASGRKSDPRESGESYVVESGVFEVRGPAGAATQNIVKSSTSVIDETSPVTSVSRKNIDVSGAVSVALRGVVYATVCAGSDVAGGRCLASQSSFRAASYRVAVRAQQYRPDGVTPCEGTGETFPAETVTISDERHHLTHTLAPRTVALKNVAACPKLLAVMTVTHAAGSAVIVEAGSRMTRLVLEAN